MTKKERYKLHDHHFFGYGIEDTHNPERMYIDDFKCIVSELNNLSNENEQLKQRNKRQYNQLVELWGLIENKDWGKLTNMVTQREEDEERLQKEWKCYE